MILSLNVLTMVMDDFLFYWNYQYVPLPILMEENSFILLSTREFLIVSNGVMGSMHLHSYYLIEHSYLMKSGWFTI